MTRRQVRQLDELAQLGLEMARTLRRQLKTVSGPRAAEITRSYAEMMTEVRKTLALKTRLEREATARTAPKRPRAPQLGVSPEEERRMRLEARRDRLREAMAAVIDSEGGAPDDQALRQRLSRALARLDDESDDCSLGDLVAAFTIALSLDPDWSRLKRYAWAAEAEVGVAVWRERPSR